MELDRKILGEFGSRGQTMKEFGSVHGIDCLHPNEVYVARSQTGECKNELCILKLSPSGNVRVQSCPARFVPDCAGVRIFSGRVRGALSRPLVLFLPFSMRETA